MPNTTLYMQSLLPTNNSFTNFKNHQNKTDRILFINNALKSVCHDKNVTFVNLYDSFLNNEGKLNELFTNDGLHLTGAGYMNWKKILIENKYL